MKKHSPIDFKAADLTKGSRINGGGDDFKINSLKNYTEVVLNWFQILEVS